MATETIKPEKDMCRCCHVKGRLKSFHDRYLRRGQEIVYSELLRECFDIVLFPVSDTMKCAICDICIKRLQVAYNFKQQILKNERKLRNQYYGSVEEGPIEVVIKQEIIDIEENSIEVPVSGIVIVKEDYDSNVSDGEVGSDGGHVSSTQMPKKTDAMETTSINKFDSSDDELPSPTTEDSPWEANNKNPKIELKKNVVNAKNAPPGAKKKKETGKKAKGEKEKRIVYKIKEDIDFKKIASGFQCCRCEKTRETLKYIRTHIIRKHLKLPKYACTECSKVFKTLAPFVKHKFDEHNIDERFRCNACDNMYNTEIQLNKHRNTYHMLGEKSKCDLCDYESFSVEALYKHKVKHRTVKEFHCRFCKKSFLRKTTMQMHERIHTGDRRKICKVCGQAFVQKASLNYHMIKYHPAVDF